MTMSDLEQARQLFTDAGLAFPTIPDKLAVKLKKRGPWLFSTCALETSPYNLSYYERESEQTHGKEYAVLCDSGHGVNSYAIQYYLVCGPLRMFLFLGWGGAYMDADAAASEIHECFSLADQIVPAAMTSVKLGTGKRLTIVCSDFYGSYWLAPGQFQKRKSDDFKAPAQILADVLRWLKDPPQN